VAAGGIAPALSERGGKAGGGSVASVLSGGMQPYYADPPMNSALLAQSSWPEMDDARVTDLARFRQAKCSSVITPMFHEHTPGFQEQELTLRIKDGLYRNRSRLMMSVLRKLRGAGPGMHSDLSLTVLKSYTR